MARTFPGEAGKNGWGGSRRGLRWLARPLRRRGWARGWFLMVTGLVVGLVVAGVGRGAPLEEGGWVENPSLRGEWRERERPALRAARGERREVVVVATSDLHGWVVRDTLYPAERPGGLAHLAPVIARLRAGTPGLVLLDGGDLFQGAPNLELTWQRKNPPPPILQMMNRMGYDAIALGNHDLERGRAGLERWIGQSAFPWLSGNTVVKGGAPLLAPYRVLEREGVRVGILGLTTPGVSAWVDEPHRRGLEFLDMEAAARRWLPVLREKERVDLVIGLLHAGGNGSYDRAMAVRLRLPLPNAAGRIADGLNGFDLIVSGHAHRLSPKKTGTEDSPYSVPVVEPGARGEAVAVARFQMQERDGRWRVAGMTREVLPPMIEPEQRLLAGVAQDLARTRTWLAEPTAVRFTAIPDTKEFYRCAGALSHLAAALLPLPRREPPSSPGEGTPEGAAFSLLPMLWRLVPPGPEEVGRWLRRAHLHRWIRYDNSLVLAELTGRQVALLLGPYARREAGLRARWSIVLFPGGLEVGIAPGGTEIVRLADVLSRQPLSTHGRYPVWVTNYHWNGGGGLAPSALVHPSQRIGEGAGSLRRLIFEMLRKGPSALPPACRPFLE